MADHPGTTDPRTVATVFAFLPGRTSGVGVPFSKTPPNVAFIAKIPFDPQVSGTPADGGGGSGLSKIIADHVGDSTEKLTFSDIWFEHVHALPRSVIDFGNILSQEEQSYEIYNSFRGTSVQLVAINNNALPGTALPNVTPPLSIPASTSILDPATTDNSGGTSLGTFVKTKILALQDGLPIFDTTIEFDTDQNDVNLLVAGTRIVFLPMEYENNVKETLAFLTDIISSLDGKEQRIALRKQPRQIFEVEYKLTDNDRQRMQAVMMDWMDNQFGFPLYHEKVAVTSAISASATLYPITGGDDVDFRVGGLAVIITDANTFDVISILSITDTLITASDPSVNAYPAGTSIMPLRIARILRSIPGRRHTNNLEVFKVTFEVAENDTGALVGSTTPGFWSLYNSRVLFDDCNVISNDSMAEQFSRKIFRIDNKTGIVKQSSTWDLYKRTHQKGFVARNRSEIIQLRKVLLALRGRQKAFYIPTFIEDLEVKAQLTISTNTMDIERIDYERFIVSRRPKKIFRITFTDDTSLVRVIQSVLSVDSTTERLTLDTTWPATQAVSTIKRVEFYELVRLDSDEIVFVYPRIGLASVRTSIRAVFDDN